MASKHQGPSPIPDGLTTAHSTPKELSWGRGQSHSTLARFFQPADGLTLYPRAQSSFAVEQTGEIPHLGLPVVQCSLTYPSVHNSQAEAGS